MASLTTQPVVSIVTPSFNREDLVGETLESVLAQSYPYWELIVVDDGSTDRTRDVVAAFAGKEPRIHLFNREGEPKGACTCRNEGVGRSRGAFVVFLDTDDILEPFCLENRVKAMEGRPELDFGIFPGLMFEREPHDLGRWWNVDKPDDELSRQFRQDAIAQGTGVMWRRESFVRIGMWNADLVIWQDIDLFFRAFIRGYRYAKFFELPPDLHNRTGPGSLSRSDFFAPAKIASRVAVLKRAVSLLSECGMSERAPEARFMMAEICIGAARSGHGDAAFELLRWGTRQGVVSASQGVALGAAMCLHLTRATRLKMFERMARELGRPFRAESTIGVLPHRDGQPPQMETTRSARFSS